MDTHWLLCQRPSQSSSCNSSLFCQGDFSSSCKHNILPCRCQCWLSGPAPFCFPCSSHTWLCSQPCSCLANSLSASFTSQWLLNTVPKFGTSPPLWLAAQFAAVPLCLMTSLKTLQPYIFGIVELAFVTFTWRREWTLGKKYPTEGTVSNSSWVIQQGGAGARGCVCWYLSVCFPKKSRSSGYLIHPEHL